MRLIFNRSTNAIKQLIAVQLETQQLLH